MKEQGAKSELYLEVIETETGTYRLGVAHPSEDGKRLESFEIDLPTDGIAQELNLNGHDITLFCRLRKTGSAA